MLQKIAAINRVIEVQPLVVALLPREVVDAIDAALGTDAVRPLHWHEAHQIDVDPQLGQLHRRCQASQSATNDHYALICHEVLPTSYSLFVPLCSFTAAVSVVW